MSHLSKEYGLLNKHIAFVDTSSSKFTFQKKLQNILLYFAQAEGIHSIYKVSLKKIRKKLGYSVGRDFLKFSLQRLLSTEFQFNIFKQDKKNDWNNIYQFLTFFEFQEDHLLFSIDINLLQHIEKPNIYIKIDLDEQLTLKRRCSIVLYEYIHKNAALNKNWNKTIEYLDIEQLKKLCSVEQYTYSDFRKQHLEPAITELNEKIPTLQINWQAIQFANQHKRKVREIKLSYFLQKSQKTAKNIIPQELEDILLDFPKEFIPAFKKIIFNGLDKSNDRNRDIAFMSRLIPEIIEKYYDGKIRNPVGFAVSEFKKNFIGFGFGAKILAPPI